MIATLRVLAEMKYTSRIMVISYQGAQSFKVSFGDTTLAFNPVNKKSKFETTKYGADVAFVTLNHEDFDGVKQVAHGSKEPFVISGPGEYEVGQVTARGFGVKTTYKGSEYYNTIYKVQFEDMNIVFLGSLENPEIDSKILGELGNIDILFVPIGGGDVLEVPQASKLAVKLEAKLVIPMYYDDVSLSTFLKEEGSEDLKPVDKITLKKKDVSEMSGEVMVLKS